MKNKGLGHLKARLCTITTSKNVGLGGPWYLQFLQISSPGLDQGIERIEALPDFSRNPGFARTPVPEDISGTNLLVNMASWWLSHPFEKYARQIGNLPQIGVKIPKIFELPPPRWELKPCVSEPTHTFESRRKLTLDSPCAYVERDSHLQTKIYLQ